MEESHNARNKRIVKNTVFLYIRTFIALTVGLYTGRIMLEALGIDNYGINNVIGGIIVFSTLITGNLAAACSRYITFSLGKSSQDESIRVFNTSLWIQFAISILAVVLLEVVGLWFLNNVADIPEGRIFAANWVFQCSIVSMVVNLIGVPYNASIIAHEDMSVYAYMSLIAAILKLVICYVILYYGGDRLILYSTLYLFVSVIVTFIYVIYCHSKYDEVKIIIGFDKVLLKEMFGYSAWNFMSQITYLLNTQGVNMLINVFYGVAFNAARGVANTISSYTQSFVDNFTMAFNPQITKSYAACDYTYCYSVVNNGAKFSWYLLLFFAVPVCVEAKTLLSLWLTDVPPMAPIFLQFCMIESIAMISSQNLLKLIQATGKVKNYTIKVSLFSSIVFPLVWISYKLGAPVWISYPIFILVYSLLIFYRFNALKLITTFDPHKYISDVLKPCIYITVLAFLFPSLIALFTQASVLRFIILVPLTIAYIGVLEYCMGLTSSERQMIKGKIRQFIQRKKIIVKV